MHQYYIALFTAFALLLLPADHGVCDDIAKENDINVDKNRTLSSKDNELPNEIQKVVCVVTAGETRASAEAVTTKTLKGVCGSVELQTAFQELEAKLFQELAAIKTLLLQQQKEAHTTNCNCDGQSLSNNYRYNKDYINMQPTTTTNAGTTYTTSTSLPITNVAINKNELLKLNFKTLPMLLPQREQEVHKFNNTLLSDRELKIFTYYWKLDNFSKYLQDSRESRVESPIFVIKSKTLHIIAHFHHLHRELLYLQIEEAKLHSSNRHNIILDTGTNVSPGNIFKKINNDKILYKHKISILDQQQQHGKDLVSQELTNLDMGFLIPHSALLASPYVKGNALLIQILLYL